MTRFERAADRYDANSRSRKRARERRAQQAELKADIALVLGEVEVVLAALRNTVVTTPNGPTTVKELAAHVQRLLRRLSVTRSRQVQPPRNPVPPRDVEAVCDAADNLLAAIDGLTNQFDGEVKALHRDLCRTRTTHHSSLAVSPPKETT